MCFLLLTSSPQSSFSHLTQVMFLGLAQRSTREGVDTFEAKRLSRYLYYRIECDRDLRIDLVRLHSFLPLFPPYSLLIFFLVISSSLTCLI